VDAPDQTEYCREVEAYLCRKNDGHLIRIVGPSFDLVSKWASTGVPLSIAFQGIDRYFERYYRKGPRRRPVRIDFCDADVLDVFDEWRRALGLPVQDAGSHGREEPSGDAAHEKARNVSSLPAQLERALMRLTDGRATGRLGAEVDSVIDRIGHELEVARAARGGVRGETRREMVERLAAMDLELFEIAWTSLDAAVRQAIDERAAAEVAPFKSGMTADKASQVCDAARRRLVRERAGLPTLELR